MKLNLVFWAIIFLGINACKTTPAKYIYNGGMIHGTPYHVVYESPKGLDFQIEIDSKMGEYNLIFSTYEKESVISKINRNENTEPNPIFNLYFEKAMEISDFTSGAFDITCGPLVNAWGFGPEKKKTITQERIDSLLQLVGYKKVKLEDGIIVKENPNMKLNMNAIGDGCFCDLIGDFLFEKGCSNFMVEIGGEVVARGKNEKGKIWTIGINNPEDDSLNLNNEIVAKVMLENRALATSGNYRNFYFENGKKYAHTIDPVSGYPVQHSLLSATVVTDNCTFADGFATAFMVLGVEKGIELAKKTPMMDVYFIYADSLGNNQVFMSEGFKTLLRD